MRRIIVDTEFEGFHHDAKLISFALVDVLTGVSFYAELTDHWDADNCDFFVVDNILDKLDLATHGMSRKAASAAAREFIESFCGQVQLASDSTPYDHEMLCQLFPTSSVWPANTNRLQSSMLDLSVQSEALDLSSQSTNPHHALHDAQQLAKALKHVLA